jgi:PEP-CTERM/exosortase A-associated glycosyltransferase
VENFMRVLHIFDHSIPVHSDYSRRSIEIIKEQRRQGIETFHVTGIEHDAPYQANETIDGIDFYRCKKPLNPLGTLSPFQHKTAVNILHKKIEEIINTENVKVIHAHSPSSNGYAALKSGLKHNIPVHYEVRSFMEDEKVSLGVWEEGSRAYLKAQKNEMYVLEQATSITAVSQTLKDEMVLRGIDEGKITVVPDFLDLQNYKGPFDANVELQERMNVQDMVMLGYIGPFDECEGIDVLIRSMRSVILRVPNACLLLVGSGAIEGELQHLASRMMLGDRVIFTGCVPRDKLSDYFNMIDIMVYGRKSGRNSEMVPSFKLIEAMARQKNIIASDIGGHKDVIENGKTGMLFKSGDPIALADRIGDFVNDRESYVQDTLKFLSIERNKINMIKKYKEIYQNEL